MELSGQPQLLTRDLEALLTTQRATTRYIQQQQAPLQLGYRWFDVKTLETRTCVTDVGMFSHGKGAGEKWHKESIHNHCNEVRKDFSSPYMSFSTSPSRMLRFMSWPRDDANAEIAVIDLRILWELQPDFEITTNLAHDFKLRKGGTEEGRTKYITDTHFLVHEFIPAPAILGFVRAGDFETICQSNEITKENDPDFSKRLNWKVLQPFIKEKSAFSIAARFIADAKTATMSSPANPYISTPPPSARVPAPYFHSATSSSSTIKSEHSPITRRRQRSGSPTPQPRNHGRRQPDFIDLTLPSVRTLPTNGEHHSTSGNQNRSPEQPPARSGRRFNFVKREDENSPKVRTQTLSPATEPLSSSTSFQIRQYQGPPGSRNIPSPDDQAPTARSTDRRRHRASGEVAQIKSEGQDNSAVVFDHFT